jgi:hypothetical protein
MKEEAIACARLQSQIIIIIMPHIMGHALAPLVRFPVVSMEFFIDVVLLTALWP